MALREAANESTVALLEPIDEWRSRSPMTRSGPVMADLRGRHPWCTARKRPDLPGYAVIR